MCNCIWCKKRNSDADIEHIIPEALGCPENFVLTGGAVCGTCNNGLGHLDRAVLDEFDIPVFMSGIRGKSGLPQVNSRGNMVGHWTAEGPIIFINMERTPVKILDGRALAAAGKSKRNVKATVNHIGNIGKVSFQTRMGEGRKFVRGIVKIAFSSLAFFHPSEVLAADFDSIRCFVTKGLGARKIIWMPAPDDTFKNEVRPPLRHESGDYYAVSFRLAMVDFIVDLSPDLRLFEIFKEKAYELYGAKGWSWLPL